MTKADPDGHSMPGEVQGVRGGEEIGVIPEVSFGAATSGTVSSDAVGEPAHAAAPAAMQAPATAETIRFRIAVMPSSWFEMPSP